MSTFWVSLRAVFRRRLPAFMICDDSRSGVGGQRCYCSQRVSGRSCPPFASLGSLPALFLEPALPRPGSGVFWARRGHVELLTLIKMEAEEVLEERGPLQRRSDGEE